MAELRELFEMTTKQMEPDQDSWRKQEERHHRDARRKKFGALPVAAAIGLVAAVLILVTMPGGESATTPGDEAPVAEQSGATPVEVATSFVGAYGTFDADRAISYLADNATVSVYAGAFDVGGAPEEWALNLSWWQAVGYEQILDSCEETGSSASGTTVRCTLDYHLFGSDRIGRGPFSGSYWDLTVRDGQIVSVTQHCETEKFSPQMWDPFAVWVSSTYPKDAAVMYGDEAQGSFVLTERSIRLWGEHTDEYVREVKRGNAE